MNSINSTILEGNLVRDPESSKTPEGKSVCKFTIASNRFFKEPEEEEYMTEVSFFRIIAMGKMADICNDRITKGSGVRVVGRLKQDRWEDSDGNRKSSVYVIADHVEFKPNYKKD